MSIVDIAREKALEQGKGLNQEELLQVLQVPDSQLEEIADIAHQTRLKWCGPDVSVEGIISIKTGGCPEDCHFCSQSGLFESPVRAVRLNIPELVEAAQKTAKSGATEFCIVAAVKSPDDRLLDQVGEAIAAINDAVDIEISCSLGTLTREQAQRLKDMGAQRYNHNLETSRSFFPNVVTTHTWEERKQTLDYVREVGMEVCCGGIIGMGEQVDDRLGMLMLLANLPSHPDSVPINLWNEVKGVPVNDTAERPDPIGLVRLVATARIMMPQSVVRLSAGRQYMTDELQAMCFLAGANSIFIGDVLLTTKNPQRDRDADLLDRLGITSRLA